MEEVVESRLVCANCCVKLERGGGKKNYAISSKTPNGLPVFEALSETFRLSQISPLTPIKPLIDSRFLCTSCANALGTAYKHLKKFKDHTNPASYLARKTEIQFPQPPEDSFSLDNSISESETSESNSQKPSMAVEIKAYLQNLLNNKTKADVLYSWIRRQINKEVKVLSTDSAFCQNLVNRDQWFPEDIRLETDLKEKAPMLFKVLNGAVLKNQNVLCFSTKMKTIVSILVHSRNRMANSFQKSVGLILLKGHATIKTYQVLMKMGLSCSYPTIIRALDTLNEDYDRPLKVFQNEKSKQIEEYREKCNVGWKAHPDDITDEISDVVPSKISRLSQNAPRPSSSKKLAFGSLAEEETEMRTFTSAMFSIDNINHHVKPNNFNSQTKPKIMNMTSAAFIKNRVPQPINEALEGPKYNLAKDIPDSAFIPTQEEIEIFKQDHQILIKRILVKNIQIFNGIQNKAVQWNIPHRYSSVTGHKSEIVTLGIMDIDEGTTEGTKQVMKYIESYAPDRGDGKKLTLCVGADTLTADFQRSTQHHLSNSDSKEELLNRTVPSVGMFHLRMALMQDIVNLFFGKRKKGDKCAPCPGVGTIPYLRARFGHPSKIQRVKHNFVPAYRFMKFCLTSYVCAYACKALGIAGENLDKPSKTYQAYSEEELINLLEKISTEMVDFEFSDIHRNTQMKKFCICQAEYDQHENVDYIACDNDACKHYLWYHIECLEGQVRDKKSKRFEFRKPPRVKDLSKSVYYCTLECQRECEDKVALYSKAVLNCMLFMEGYRDSIRYADGMRMDAYNKLHLITFFNKNHPNMLRVCHFWQCNKHGLADQNVRHDLMFNSCVNVLGNADSNIEMDLYHEFMNHYLKEMLLLPSGNSTETSIARRSKGFQVLKDIIVSVEQQQQQDSSKNSKKHAKYLVDLKPCVMILEKEDLFCMKGKRHHNGFEKFKNNLNFLDNVSLYREKLQTLSNTLDDVKEYQEEERNTEKTDTFLSTHPLMISQEDENTEDEKSDDDDSPGNSDQEENTSEIEEAEELSQSEEETEMDIN